MPRSVKNAMKKLLTESRICGTISYQTYRTGTGPSPAYQGEYMLTLKNITWTAPDGHKVVKGIDLTIPDKKLVVITGPNGGGKTTLAKMIAGLEKPDTGSIELDGKDITNAGITERARMGIGFAFQQPVRFKGVTVADLMELATGKKDCGREACDYLVRVGLCAKDYLDREVDSTLSGGEIKRIELATVLARHTRLSVFDEPEAGIDLWSFNNLIDVFTDIRKNIEGSVVIISHQERILAVADEIVVIAGGKVANRGAGKDLLPELMKGGMGCTRCPKSDVVYGGKNNG